jgi:molybdate transport system substrate-binding protein
MIRLYVATAAATMLAASANAIELKVISAGAVRSVVGHMIDDYSKSTGVKFKFTVGPTGLLRSTIASGEPADLIIASAPLMAELEASGKMTPGSRTDLGRIGLGVVIRDGAPVPDVSTPEKFKQLLIDAKSIAYTDPKLGGTSALHLMKLAERFGIRDELVKKGIHATAGNDASAKVGRGEAEISVTLISEIGEAKGARLAAPLPEALQLWTVYAAAIPLASTAPNEARAFVAALTGPMLREHWIKAGWQPAK